MITLKDEAMAQVIKSRLGSDLRTGGQTIEVRVTDGEILLYGICDSEEQRSVAEMIVKGTCGARRVIDEVQVRRLKQGI